LRRGLPGRPESTFIRVAYSTPRQVVLITARHAGRTTSGRWVDPHNEEELIAALHELASDPEKRRAMAQAGRMRAAEFTWDKVEHSG
jgi:glycosyltransferase involved in cell wall biosynthesis